MHEARDRASSEVVHDCGRIVGVDLFVAEPGEAPDHHAMVTRDETTRARVDGEARILLQKSPSTAGAG